MKTIIFVLLMAAHCAFAGFERRGTGARAAGLANASVALADDALALRMNAGALTRLERTQLALYYEPQPFGIDELSSGGVSAAFPTPIVVIGVGGTQYGFDLYKEISGSLGCAGKISGIGVGFMLNYYSVAIKRYGSAGSLAADLGVVIPLWEKVSMGVSMMNFTGATIGASRERIPQSLTFGLGYTPVPSLRLAIDVQKELSFEASARFGVEYQPLKAIIVRGGVANNPSTAAGGIGLRVHFVNFDFALSHHPELGWSNTISLLLEWRGTHENED